MVILQRSGEGDFEYGFPWQFARENHHEKQQRQIICKHGIFHSYDDRKRVRISFLDKVGSVIIYRIFYGVYMYMIQLTYTDLCAYVCKHVHTCTYMYTCTYVYIPVHTCTYMSMHVKTCTYMYTHVHT